LATQQNSSDIGGGWLQTRFLTGLSNHFSTSLLLLSLERTVNDSVFDFFYMMANYLENNDHILEDDFDILEIIDFDLSISILLMN
jgi:hypothetical protein